MRFGQNPKPKNEKISDRPVKEKSKSVSQIRKQTPFEVKQEYLAKKLAE